MAKQTTIKLRKAEVNYLWSLVSENKREGCYWGPREQFHKRQDEVLEKLQKADKELGYENSNLRPAS